jgi:hypothetical protein
MSYNTHNIIVTIENDENELIVYFSENFKFFNTKIFYTPFRGIVCQSFESWTDYPFDNFPDNFFKNQIEVENYFGNGIHEKVKNFSLQFPNKEIAYTNVDCYGGKCSSEGYVIKNNNKIQEQESHHSGHKYIIQKIYPEFNTWFFYPFTRTFYNDQGGLNGEIVNFTLPAIWMSFNMELSENPDFEINVTENELLILNRNLFEIYLMSLSQERIKVMGTLIKNDKETIDLLIKLLESNLEGIEHYIEIDNFENAEKYVISNFDKEKYLKIASESYRKVPFNERTFQFPDNNSNTTKSNLPKKKGFWNRLFGK